MKNSKISKTGIIHGRGSDPYKWVSGLTSEERALVRSGGLVLIPDSNPHPSCTKYKKVIYDNGRYYHRCYKGGTMKKIGSIKCACSTNCPCRIILVWHERDKRIMGAGHSGQEIIGTDIPSYDAAMQAIIDRYDLYGWDLSLEDA